MTTLKQKYEDKIFEKLTDLNDGDNQNAIQLFHYMTGTDDTFKWLKENDLDQLREMHFEYKMQFDFANEFANYLEEKGFDRFNDFYQELTNLSSAREVAELVEKTDKKRITKHFEKFSEYFNGDTLDPDFCPELEDYVNSEGATILELGMNYFIDMDDKEAVIAAFKKHNKEEYKEGLDEFKQEQEQLKSLVGKLTNKDKKQTLKNK